MVSAAVCLPGGGDKGLGSHEEEEHDEGANQVGVEHFISHLGELEGKNEHEHVLTKTQLKLKAHKIFPQNELFYNSINCYLNRTFHTKIIIVNKIIKNIYKIK